MIVGPSDTVTPYQFALDAYEQAREPKEIKVSRAATSTPTTDPASTSSPRAARDHFVKHLGV